MKCRRTTAGCVIELPRAHQYLVKVTKLVSQTHLVTAPTAEDAERMAPEAEMVGEPELIDIVDSVRLERLK